MGFARLLRSRGVPASTGEAVDAARAALEAYPAGGLAALKPALRAALVKRREHLEVFERAFNEYWLGGLFEELGVAPRRVEVRVEASSPVEYFLSVYSPLESRLGAWEEPGAREGLARRIAGGLRALRRSVPLGRRRRWRASQRGAPDLRAAMRLARRAMGEPLWIPRRARLRGRAKLVGVFDVSRSMSDEWPWLIAAMYAFRSLPPGDYEVFAFSTRLARLTGAVQEARSPGKLARAAARGAWVWGGGTRIGESLLELVTRHPGALTGRSLVLIVSDGWDLGDEALIEEALLELRRRAGAVAWLSPHAGSPGFSPETPALRAAARHCHALAPTSSLESPRGAAELARVIAASPR